MPAIFSITSASLAGMARSYDNCTLYYSIGYSPSNQKYRL